MGEGRDVCYIVRGTPSESLEASVPPDVFAALEATRSPKEIERILADNERRISQFADDNSNGPDGPYILHDREFLDCDEMATLMGWALSMHDIDYTAVIGHSNEGSSHAWVRVGRKNFDPTHQGFKGPIEHRTFITPSNWNE